MSLIAISLLAFGLLVAGLVGIALCLAAKRPTPDRPAPDAPRLTRAGRPMGVCQDCGRLVALRKRDGQPYAGRHQCHIREAV
jgi:hypothetical protein